MSAESTSNIFTVGEVAAYLKLPISTVYRLAERREIPGHKVGRQWRFQRAVIDEWLRKRSETRTTTILVAGDAEEGREGLAGAPHGPPGVLVARHAESDLMRKVLEIGPFTVLQKPLDIQKFRKVIDLIV